MKGLEVSELNSDASIGAKSPPKLEGDALEGSAANTPGFQVHVLIDVTNVLRQKVIKRKLLFSKWKIACGFHGLQVLAQAVLILPCDVKSRTADECYW